MTGWTLPPLAWTFVISGLLRLLTAIVLLQSFVLLSPDRPNYRSGSLFRRSMTVGLVCLFAYNGLDLLITGIKEPMRRPLWSGVPFSLALLAAYVTDLHAQQTSWLPARLQHYYQRMIHISSCNQKARKQALAGLAPDAIKSDRSAVGLEAALGLLNQEMPRTVVVEPLAGKDALLR